MEKYLYEAVIYPCGEAYEARIPDLDLITQGSDLADAAFMAQDVMALAISSRLNDGEEVAHVGPFGRECPEGGTLMGIAVFAEPTDMTDETMTVQEAADILDVSRSRVHAMINDGILGTCKVGNMRMVSAKDVMERFNNPRSAGRPAKQAALA